MNCLTNLGSIAAPLLQELRWIARKITPLSPSPSVGEGRGEGETRHGHPMHHVGCMTSPEPYMVQGPPQSSPLPTGRQGGG